MAAFRESSCAFTSAPVPSPYTLSRRHPVAPSHGVASGLIRRLRASAAARAVRATTSAGRWRIRIPVARGILLTWALLHVHVTSRAHRADAVPSIPGRCAARYPPMARGVGLGIGRSLADCLALCSQGRASHPAKALRGIRVGWLRLWCASTPSTPSTPSSPRTPITRPRARTAAIAVVVVVVVVWGCDDGGVGEDLLDLD